MEKSRGRMHVFDMLKANLIESLGKREGKRVFDAFLKRHDIKRNEWRADKGLLDVTQPLLPKAVA
jgi:hypothetical protein